VAPILQVRTRGLDDRSRCVLALGDDLVAARLQLGFRLWRNAYVLETHRAAGRFVEPLGIDISALDTFSTLDSPFTTPKNPSSRREC